MRKIRALIGNIVDIEESRARYMARVIFSPRIAPLLRQIPRTVQNPQIRILEMCGQPFGGNECFRIVLHQSLS